MTLIGRSPVDPDIRLVRPLLEASRTEIEACARQRGIRFREDRSNADRRFLRNRIRHDLLPLLREQYQPAIDRVLVRTASILSAESECVTGLASAWLKGSDGSFDRLPLAVRRRAVQLQAIALGLVLEFETCEHLLRQPGRTVNAPGGVILSCGPDGRLRRVTARLLDYCRESVRLVLATDGRTRFGGREFFWQVVAGRKPVKLRLSPNVESFDAEQVGDTILLRHWRVGDRFQPIGMSNGVKLQDLFTNQKVPVTERRSRVVAESALGEIFWVEGLRIGDRFKVRPDTAKWLVWRWAAGNSFGCSG